MADHETYADASKGPFLCGVCDYFKAPTTCEEPHIVRLRNGVVEYYACCDFFEPNPARKSTAALLRKEMKS